MSPPSDVGGVKETKALVCEMLETFGELGREGLKTLACNVRVPERQPCAQYCQAIDCVAKMLKLRVPA